MLSSPRILMDMRWAGPHGIGRFATELFARLPGVLPLRARTALFNPIDPLLLSARLLRSRVDVFFSPGFNAPLRERIPMVLTVHDLNYIHYANNSNALRRAYFNSIVRPACRRAFRVLTVSEFSRLQIADWAGLSEEAVVNVGAGVNAVFCREGPRFDPGFPYLLAIGSDRPHKNMWRLIQAFGASGLARDLRLLIVGGVDPHSAILLKEPEYASAVRLLGHVPDEELPLIYRGAMALCMPSLYEGFGLPVLEAMACGVPVLTSNVTSLPEVSGGATMLVDPANIESITSALREIVHNESLRSTLVENGLKRSADFSWNRTAHEVSKILHQAGGYGSRPSLHSFT